MPDPTRRAFIKTTAAAVGAAALTPATLAQTVQPVKTLKELRVLQVGIGGIGGLDRNKIASHPRARIVGLVDVNKPLLNEVAKGIGDVFTETDYRKAFADHNDAFDAVVVCTPDHTHAAPMLLGLAHDKHVYGQKPLVHQLEELTLLEKAVNARPHLATQTGNQRMEIPGRRVAVDILRRNLLGPAREAWVWTTAKFGSTTAIDLPAEKTAPQNLDWDLWLGPAKPQPYRDGIAPFNWRAWWEFGTAGLGDWGVHLLDVVFYGYPELTSPVTVQCNTPRAADWYHAAHCTATMTYAVASDRFSSDIFPIHYHDVGLVPSLRSLGIHKPGGADKNATAIVCESGTMLITSDGALEVFRNGKRIDLKELGEMIEPEPIHH
ncbi:MAG: Gfo/Idh/MocA family protein, partial [Phycisphaeraceae bacterium]